MEEPATESQPAEKKKKKKPDQKNQQKKDVAEVSKAKPDKKDEQKGTKNEQKSEQKIKTNEQEDQQIGKTDEQKGKTNEQKDKTNEQKGKTNKQKGKTNEQKGKTNEQKIKAQILKQGVSGSVADNYHFYDAPKDVGDTWWSNFMGRACRKIEGDTHETSGPPFLHNDQVMVQFEDQTIWRVPHLIPSDLDRMNGDGLPSVPSQQEQPKPKKAPKAKAKAKERPVKDFEQKTVRAKFSFQGKNDPIVKVEAREDRNDCGSRWKQKFQIVVRGEMCANSAMNVATTFCQLYQGMNLNPSVLDFKECRDALIGMKGRHDWTQGPMDWQHVAALCLKGFPPKFLG